MSVVPIDEVTARLVLDTRAERDALRADLDVARRDLATARAALALAVEECAKWREAMTRHAVDNVCYPRALHRPAPKEGA